MSDFTGRVYATVRRIPYAHVASYGDIASLLGTPRAARGVGFALRALPQGSDVPWWRVVNSTGGISLGSFEGRMQRMMLEQEGVRFGHREKVDLRRYRWRPE